jgi:hypothetical protein
VALKGGLTILYEFRFSGKTGSRDTEVSTTEISSCPIHATTLKELIQKADEALYESKRRIMNQTTITGE